MRNHLIKNRYYIFAVLMIVCGVLALFNNFVIAAAIAVLVAIVDILIYVVKYNNDNS